MGRGTSWWQFKGKRTRKMEKGTGQGEKGNEANGRKKDPEIRPIGCRGIGSRGRQRIRKGRGKSEREGVLTEGAKRKEAEVK